MCWHKWGMWQTIKEGTINLLSVFDNTKIKGYEFVNIQKRKCLKCGYEQINKQRISY